MAKLVVKCLITLALSLGFLSLSNAAVPSYNQSADGIMLHGYDPVSYFDGQPEAGAEAHSLSYQRKIYYFKSAENKQRFLVDPERFQPSYGGFCAFGVRMAKKFDIDPEAYQIVDGRLYVLLNRATLGVWQEDTPSNIAIANNNWPKIKEISPAEL